MTEGHKHRTVEVKRGSLVYRLLKKQFFVTASGDRAEKSRFVYGPAPCPARGCTDMNRYGLSLLGLLHPLTGLTLEVK